MQKCLQSTWRELGVVYVEFLQTAGSEASMIKLTAANQKPLIL